MIKLRALEPEDLDALYELENDRAEWESGTSNVPFSRYALHDYIAHNSYDIYADKQLRQAVELNGTVVGLVDMVNFDPRNGRAEVSIITAKEYRRKGIATQSLAHIIEYARDFLHLHQLYAIVPENNAASIGLFQKLNFMHTSTLQSWIANGKEMQNAMFFQLILKKD